MLDAINGADVGAPYIIPKPERPYLEEVGLAPGQLRIAFTIKSPLGTDVHPECREAVEKAAKMLEGLGHKVEEAEPAIDGIALAKSYFTMYFGEIAADIEELGKVLGRKPKPSDIENPTWALNLLGKTLSAGKFVLAMRQWNIFARHMGLFLQKYHLYLTPTTAFPPVRIGELKPKPAEEIAMKVVNTLGLGKLMMLSGIPDQLAIQNLAKTPYTQLANITGLPAMSVPLHWTKDGLPCGVHFVARFGDEATLFRLASQLEKAQPWFDKHPSVIA
jgi:amidase